MEWILLTVLAWNGAGGYTTASHYKTFEECKKAISTFVCKVPNGNENEAGCKAVCVKNNKHKRNFGQ